LLGGVIGVVVALVAACGSSSHHAGATARSGDTLASSVTSVASSSTSVPPTTPILRVLGTTLVPIDRGVLHVGLGAVWSASSHGLVRLSLGTAQPTVVLSSPVDDIALAGCCIYALSGSTNKLIEYDPRLMKTTRQWTMPAGAHSLAAADHRIYVALSGPPAAVERIDLQSGATQRTTVAHASGLARDRAIAASPDRVWVTDGNNLYVLDPATLKTLKSINLPALVSDVWFGDGSAWAASQDPNGGVTRIDPASGRVLASVNTSDAIQMAFAPHAVWLAAAAGPTAIDPVTGATETSLPFPSVVDKDSAAIAVVGNQVWTVYADAGKLQRILVSSK
jgi:hypothetical protein